MYLLHTIMSYMSSEYSPAMCVFSLPVQVEAMAKSLFWGSRMRRSCHGALVSDVNFWLCKHTNVLIDHSNEVCISGCAV